MIIGTLHDTGRVECLHPLFKTVFRFLREHDRAALLPGTLDIAGEDAYLKVENVNGRTRENARHERHERYIDIQLPLSGSETYGWAPRENLREEDAPYDGERDIVFYRDPVERVVTLHPGEFVIFFPEDAHAPCIDCGKLRKAVVKVLIR